MRISDWSSDVCSSDLRMTRTRHDQRRRAIASRGSTLCRKLHHALPGGQRKKLLGHFRTRQGPKPRARSAGQYHRHDPWVLRHGSRHLRSRSEEHTSELQSLMRISYAVFCLKKKQTRLRNNTRPSCNTFAPPTSQRRNPTCNYSTCAKQL